MDAASLPATVGEFRITAVLGQGGSGIVYDAAWGPRRVALKVLHPSLVGTERVRTQFFAEAERLKAIAHPSVVKVLAVGELPDGRPYLAMERLDGETLAQVLARGPLALPHALELFAELCAAVGALHEQGLIHRDLKPENAFVVGNAHAVLLDFGIAKELAAPASTTTQDGGVRGTPAYMAPERFFGTPASAATDIYELAVMLYAMLAGRLPWDDLGDPEARLSPRPLVDHCAVPAELDVEIRRALSTRAQNRPATPAELLAAVRTAAGGEVAPGPAETARMRPAGDALPTTESGKPWFAERQPTTDRGKTPLAWAPTQRAPEPPAEVARRRWPWLAAGLVVVALGGGALVWKLTRGGGAAQVVAAGQLAADKDPWGAGAAAPTTSGDAPKPAPLPEQPALQPGPPLPAAQARAELAAAVARLPLDDQLLAAVLVDDLRGDARIANAIRGALRRPDIALTLAVVPECLQRIAATADWAAVGAVSLQAQQGTIIARGPWTRAQVTACFGAPKATTLPGGAVLLELPDLGWLDFPDEHTIYLSIRRDLDAAAVHARATGKVAPGGTAKARALLAGVPKDRAFALAIDGADAAWPNEGLPRGTDAVGWLRPTVEGLAAELTIDTHDEPSAAAIEMSWRARLADLFGALNTATVGSAVLVRDRSSLHVQARLTTLALKMLAK